MQKSVAVEIQSAAQPESVAGVEAYIDKPEVARRLGKTVRTVDTYMRKGIVPFYKLGRTVAFKWSDVDEHLKANYRVCLRRSS